MSDLQMISKIRDLRRLNKELYEALYNLVESIEDAGGHDENGDVFDIREACAALAKAESK